MAAGVTAAVAVTGVVDADSDVLLGPLALEDEEEDVLGADTVLQLAAVVVVLLVLLGPGRSPGKGGLSSPMAEERIAVRGASAEGGGGGSVGVRVTKATAAAGDSGTPVFTRDDIGEGDLSKEEMDAGINDVEDEVYIC